MLGTFNLSTLLILAKASGLLLRKTTLSRVLGGDELRIRGDAGSSSGMLVSQRHTQLTHHLAYIELIEKFTLPRYTLPETLK